MDEDTDVPSAIANLARLMRALEEVERPRVKEATQRIEEAASCGCDNLSVHLLSILAHYCSCLG